MILSIDNPAFIAFFGGAMSGLLWCAIGFAAGWVMFRAPLGRRSFKASVRIAAPVEKIWSTYLLEPSPSGGWGGGVEISGQGFEGDPPTRHRALIRHGGLGPFRESVWRIDDIKPGALFRANQESIDGVALRAHETFQSTLRFTPDAEAVLVEHETRRIVHGLFGFVYIERASRLALEHLRRHCEGGEAAKAAPLISRSVSFALAGAAFLLLVLLVGLGNPGAWEVAAFVAFFLQLALWTHEYGHLIAMRWFGHRDATLVLVPLFGGATIGARQPQSRFEEAVVALMGPAFSGAVVLALTPFAPLGLSYFLAPPDTIDWSTWLGLGVIAFLAMAIPINLYNLTPIGVLDGGRVIAALAQGRVMRGLLTAGVLVVLAFAIGGVGRESHYGVAVAFVSVAWASALLGAQKQKIELAPMTRRERITAFALLMVTLAIHVDASRSLLPSFIESMRSGLVSEVERERPALRVERGFMAKS